VGVLERVEGGIDGGGVRVYAGVYMRVSAVKFFLSRKEWN